MIGEADPRSGRSRIWPNSLADSSPLSPLPSLAAGLSNGMVVIPPPFFARPARSAGCRRERAERRGDVRVRVWGTPRSAAAPDSRRRRHLGHQVAVGEQDRAGQPVRLDPHPQVAAAPPNPSPLPVQKAAAADSPAGVVYSPRRRDAIPSPAASACTRTARARAYLHAQADAWACKHPLCTPTARARDTTRTRHLPAHTHTHNKHNHTLTHNTHLDEAVMDVHHLARANSHRSDNSLPFHS